MECSNLENWGTLRFGLVFIALSPFLVLDDCWTESSSAYNRLKKNGAHIAELDARRAELMPIYTFKKTYLFVLFIDCEYRCVASTPFFKGTFWISISFWMRHLIEISVSQMKHYENSTLAIWSSAALPFFFFLNVIQFCLKASWRMIYVLCCY